MPQHKAVDLLANENFINYCFGLTAHDLSCRQNYLTTHPHIKENIEELKDIALLTSRSVKNAALQLQLKKLKQQIDYKEKSVADLLVPALISLFEHKNDITRN